MQANPNIYDVSYTRPDASGRSAARLVRYLTRRPEDKERPGPESRWHTLHEDQVFGNPEAFKREADRRRRERMGRHERNGTDAGQDHSPENVAYVHVVISPANRERFRDEDFGALVTPWVRDRKGRPCPWMAVVHHDDREGPKVHLAVARGRYHRTKELPQLKERTAELIQEREMLLERSRYHAQEMERSREPRLEREATMQERQHDHEQQREEEARREEQAQEEQAREEQARAEEERMEEERQVEERRRQREERERAEREHTQERGR